MDVKPWEPVTGGYFPESQWPILPKSLSSFYGFYPSEGTPVFLTLANGQHIVARPLSEDRKAARVAIKAKALGLARSQEEIDQMALAARKARNTEMIRSVS